MISLLLSDTSYIQDIRELFMAFYPGVSFCYHPDEEAIIQFTLKKEGEEYGLILQKNGEKTCGACRDKGDRRETKNALKVCLYQMLSRTENRTLPWGTLTGIRPVKLAVKALEEGAGPEEVRERMAEQYRMRPEKAKLCVETALRERELLKGMEGEKGVSLYIGIPFCPTICVYCSFGTYTLGRWKGRVEEYVKSLLLELSMVADILKGQKLTTIYMGGGTPTSLSARELTGILSFLRENFDLSALRELSVEAGRPDSVDEEKLRALLEAGADRISINPQSMRNETLKRIGRGHTQELIRERFALARKIGFQNINMDIILGLPGETPEDVAHTMEEISRLSPDSITIHSLALKRAAALQARRDEFLYHQRVDMEKMMEVAVKGCRSLSMAPYYLYRQKNMAGNFENVGYAKRGKECLYNILIMEEKQTIIACGAGTTTKLLYPEENRIERMENSKDPGVYMERLPSVLETKRKRLNQYKEQIWI